MAAFSPWNKIAEPANSIEIGSKATYDFISVLFTTAILRHDLTRRPQSEFWTLRLRRMISGVMVVPTENSIRFLEVCFPLYARIYMLAFVPS